jgi:hypothetical protein
MSNTTVDYKQEIKELKDELKEVKKIAEAKMQDAKKEGKKLLGVEGFDLDTIQNKAKDAGKSVSAFLKDQQQNLNDMKKSCKDHIEENPTKSFFYALAGGALAAVILNNIFRK